MNAILAILDWINYGDNTGKAVVIAMLAAVVFAFTMSAILP